MTVIVAHSRSWLRVVALLAAALAQQATWAAPDEDHKGQGLRALAREMSTCAAYFSLASSMLASALPDDEGAMRARYDIAGKLMLARSIEVASAIDLDADAVTNWSELALRQMVKEINDDPANSAEHMMRKYDEPCKKLLRGFGTWAGKLLHEDRGK